MQKRVRNLAVQIYWTTIA